MFLVASVGMLIAVLLILDANEAAPSVTPTEHAGTGDHRCDRLAEIGSQLALGPPVDESMLLVEEASLLMPRDWSITADALREDMRFGAWSQARDRIDLYLTNRC